MHRREFVKLLSLSSLSALSGCGILNIDPMHYLLRSPIIDSPEKEREILSRAKLGWTDSGAIRVLYVSGTSYERGYQHGALLRKEVQDNLGYMHERALKVYHSAELFVEAFERARPYIPEDYMQEMHGLAHGSKLPLQVIHDIHILPSLTEWGGKKRLKGIVKEMISGELSTSCSNIGTAGAATKDGKIYAVRILDWGLHKISKLHQYPLLCVNIPSAGNSYVNIGWVGFLGAISGMNDQGITLGEMGYEDPPNETLEGRPMPFALREILAHASNLNEVGAMIKSYPGDNSFVFVMSDGKSKTAELYIKDHDRFLSFKQGDGFSEENVAPIMNTVYGGHFNSQMTELLSAEYGKLDPEFFMRTLIPQIAMKSNFQNVIYSPQDLSLWVSNAKSKDERAAEQPYTYFNFAAALAQFKRDLS